MKKIFTGICAAALIFSLSVSSAFAAGPRCGRNSSCKTPASITQACKAECNFIDDNKDGICDNQGLSGCTKNGTGANAQRKCGRNRR